MKKRELSNIGLLGLVLLYMFIFFIIVLTKNYKIMYIFNTIYMVILVFVSYTLLGFRKLKVNYINSYLFKIVFIYCIITLVIMYGMGFLVGFEKSLYTLQLKSIFRYQLIPIVIILLMEFFRYIVIWANKDSKKTIIGYIGLITIIDLLINMKTFEFDSFSTFLTTITMLAIPIIVKNILLSYLCYHSGYKTTIIYRIIMDGYLILMPYTPRLDQIVILLILVNLPILIYLKCSKIIDQRNNNTKPTFNTNNSLILKFSIGTCIFVAIGLVSGLFPHYLVGIRSNSMNPKIYKGDAVIIEKLNKRINVKKGDIISFKDKNNIIVHRVVKVKNNRYITKGDNNNVEDDKELKRSDIKGIVRLKIPKIAWPTIWITELFHR